ncbi:hypothetical protein [Morganella morganii]|uniref:hypothetical protein n=1 Tax=Morganella morganii TaxID=582 RepID=UPI0021D39DD6|nr:hypothetical protein [Morganella morganii]
MKVTVEHNGEIIWYRDNKNGTGMSSRGYLTDGTQQKIVTALIDALTQANGEISLSRPVGEVCLTLSDEQLKEIAKEVRAHRAFMPALYTSRDITIDSPKIKVTGGLAPTERIASASIDCLEVIQMECEAALKYIKSELCNNPDKLATCVIQSLMDYCRKKLATEPENEESHPIFLWGKWQRHS